MPWTMHLGAPVVPDENITYSGSLKARWTKSISPGHATIRIGDSTIFLADASPEWQAKGPQELGGTPVVIHLYVEDVDAVVAQAAEAGGTVVMPVQNTFWGDRYGKLIDPFGHSWSVATHVRDVPLDEMDKAAQEMFA